MRNTPAHYYPVLGRCSPLCQTRYRGDVGVRIRRCAVGPVHNKAQARGTRHHGYIGHYASITACLPVIAKVGEAQRLGPFQPVRIH